MPDRTTRQPPVLPRQAASAPPPPPPELDDTDRRILAALARDGRAPISRVAAACNIARATAYARIDRLTELGVIRGHSVVVDHARAGLGLTVLVLVSGAQPDWQDTRRTISAFPEVEYAWFVAGSADIVVLLRLRDTRELRDVILARLQSIPGVTRTETLLVIDEIAHRPAVLPR
jgi:DNA-binding Lrp family transcriptional regulator